jgi:hypothetical protein
MSDKHIRLRSSSLPQVTYQPTKTPIRCRQLKHMIGNTPLLAIRFMFRGEERTIYAKAENLNLLAALKTEWRFTF